ncbi:MAG TPA: hypothetical protein VMW43_13315 [Bacteroidota bacterium]|nr:hypothetical protein [Bacteroidota bacterium]
MNRSSMKSFSHHRIVPAARKICALLILFAVCLQTAGSLVVYAGFILNRGYIARTLCVNRNNPEMHCNGACHLARELNKEKEREQNPVSSARDKQETSPCLAACSSPRPPVPPAAIPFSPPGSSTPLDGYFPPCFHPPAV